MKKYQVEPDVNALYDRVGGRGKTIRLYLLSPTLFVLVVAVGPAYMYWVIYQKYLSYQYFILPMYFLLSNALTAYIWVQVFAKKKAYILPLLSDLIIFLHVLVGAIFFGIIAGYGLYYNITILFICVISNFLVIKVARDADGSTIDRLLAPVFRYKDEDTFICNPDYTDDNFLARFKCNEIIQQTKYGWTITVLSWSLFIVIPLFLYLFPDVFTSDTGTSQGTLRAISVGFFLLYLGSRKSFLYQLLLFRAIRRREIGYGVEG